MLMKSEQGRAWNHSVGGIVTLGKFLSLRREQLSKDEYRKMIRAELELDESSANKLAMISKHPILSNPEYYDALPPAWGTLYELRFLPDDVLLAKIKDRSLISATKYDIWNIRGIKVRDRDRVLNPAAKVKVPEGATLVDHCREGLRIENETGKSIEEVAVAIGIGRQSYRLVRTIILLSQRDELSNSDTEIIERTFELINKTRNVRTYYKDVKPIIDRVWGGSNRNKTYDDKSAKKRIEIFRNAVTIVYDTCERASRLEQPLMPIADLDTTIDELTEARKLIGQITENLRRARND